MWGANPPTWCIFVGAKSLPEYSSYKRRDTSVQHSMEKHGAPLSLFETKPLNFWQRLIEHHRITHIIDFSPGSGALAVAATGAVEYEGVAATTAHHTFLDSVVDKCTLYQAGKTKDFVRKLGGDGELEAPSP